MNLNEIIYCCLKIKKNYRNISSATIKFSKAIRFYFGCIFITRQIIYQQTAGIHHKPLLLQLIKAVKMKEQSHFGNWWLWVMLWVFILFFGYAFIQQIILSKPLGDELLGDNVIIGFMIFFSVILTIMWLTKLSIHIKEEGFEYQFFPWHKKPILLSWDKIQSVKTREVIVMGEFGS
jgi:hypothetical protein